MTEDTGFFTGRRQSQYGERR